MRPPTPDPETIQDQPFAHDFSTPTSPPNADTPYELRLGRYATRDYGFMYWPYDPAQEWGIQGPSSQFGFSSQLQQPGQAQKSPKENGRIKYASPDLTYQQPFNPRPAAPNNISKHLHNGPEHGYYENEAYQPSATIQTSQRPTGPKYSYPDTKLTDQFEPQDWPRSYAIPLDDEQSKGLSIMDGALPALPANFLSSPWEKRMGIMPEHHRQVRLPSTLDLLLPQNFEAQSLSALQGIAHNRDQKACDPGERSGRDLQAKLKEQRQVPVEFTFLSDTARLNIRSRTPSPSPTASSDIDLVSLSGDSEDTGQFDRNSQAYHIFSRVLCRLAILGQDEVVTRGETSSSSSKGKQVAKSGSTNPPQARGGARTTRGLKNQREDDDHGDDGRDRRNEPPLKRGKTGQSQHGGRSRFLACPYWKSDPEKYWDCFLKKNDTIAHLKQHLTRRHTPKYYCQICYQTFREFDVFDSHAMERSCVRGPAAKLEGISQQQKNRLSLRSKGSVEEQWYTIWSILFPCMDPPATVYIYSTQSEDLCRIHEFAQREGVAIMLDELSSSGLVVRSDASNQLLRSTVQRAMVSIFRSYFIRREPSSGVEEPTIRQVPEPDHGVSLQQESIIEGPIGHGTDVSRVMEVGTDNPMVGRLNRPSMSTWSQLPATTSWSSRGVVRDDTEDEPWGLAFLDEPAFGESSSGNDLPFNFESSEILDLDALLRDVARTEA